MAATLKSLFSKESEIDSTIPRPPTGKQILEDIENCSMEDPSIIFGELIQERVNALGSGTDGHNLGSSLHFRHSKKFDSEEDAEATTFTELLDNQSLILLRKMLSTSNKGPTTQSSSALKSHQPMSPAAPIPESADIVLLRLRNLSSECERAQDIVSALEPQLRTLKSDTLDFLNSIERVNVDEELDNK